MNGYKEILGYKLFEYKLLSIQVHVHHLVALMLIVVITKLLLGILKRLINRRLSQGGVDKGRSKALFQLVEYIIVVVAFVIAFNVIGLDTTAVLVGSSALLIGFGLGIQDLFNDFVSGIVLLFEGTVSMDDVIEVDGIVGQVKNIDLRTSKIETRDHIVIIIPNSKLVGENVINWSHNRENTRFIIKVGVAYGSDVKLVKSLLEDAANEHKSISKHPMPVARFVDFGNSSLDFEIVFFSREMFKIEFIKSDIRFLIDEKFRKNNVTIPFPQRDVHVYNHKIGE